MHPDPRRRSRHSRGERDVLAGGAGQNMIGFSFPACGRGNSARRALPGESVGRKGGLGPSGLFTGCRPDLLGVPSRASPLDGRGLDTLQGSSHPPQSLPLGGRTVRGTVRSGPGEATINHRCPSAHTGADEGAIDSPNGAGEGRRRGDRTLFLQGKVGYRIAPSSVTFGDSFPPRGSLRRWYTPATKYFLTYPPLPQNANPNQGTYMGHEIAPPPEQCGTTAETSERQRAGHKPGGAGALPRDSLRPGFL